MSDRRRTSCLTVPDGIHRNNCYLHTCTPPSSPLSLPTTRENRGASGIAKVEMARIRGTDAFRTNALAFPSSSTPVLGGLHILSFAFSGIRGLPAADAGLELITSVRERDDLPCPHWNGVKTMTWQEKAR